MHCRLAWLLLVGSFARTWASPADGAAVPPLTDAEQAAGWRWLDGEKTLAYQLGSPEVLAAVANSKFQNVPGFGIRARGHLLLQDHGGEVWFRNLKLREFTE